MSLAIEMKVIFLAVCVLQVVYGYPGYGGPPPRNGGYLYRADNSGQQVIPVHLMRNQPKAQPKQQFYIVPYSRLTSASDSYDSHSHNGQSDDGESDEENSYPLYSGGKQSRCPFAKQYGQSDDTEMYDDQQESNPHNHQSHHNKPRVQRNLNGYSIGWSENSDGSSD